MDIMDNKILGEPHVNAILGMTEEDAISRLKLLNKVMRVINRDGQGLMVAMDINQNRVNVYVKNGKVVHLANMG